MRQLYFSVVLFLLLALEGIALELLPSPFVNSSFMFVPHWIYIFLLFIVLFYDNELTSYSIIYGIVFGLLIDIVYTEVLGVYMFAYPLSLFVVKELKKFFHTTIYITILLGIIGLAITDTAIQTVYFAIGIADSSWNYYFINRLLPTIIGNGFFLLFLNPILKNRLLKWQDDGRQ